MAEMFSISRRSLQRRLGESGTSYSRLLREARYSEAACMLAESDMRVVDVAHSIGYTDASHFARFFRQMAGITPRHYRELHQRDTFAAEAAAD